MADDTVEAAREALVAAIQINSAHIRGDGAFPTLIPEEQIDALIAAVRADEYDRLLALSAAVLATMKDARYGQG